MKETRRRSDNLEPSSIRPTETVFNKKALPELRKCKFILIAFEKTKITI
jgi:hypothetical protein